MGNNIVRNSSVELLRFFFMYMIVIGHIYVHGTGIDYHLIYSWGNEWTTAPHLSLFALSKVGVTGFMFISGYYGIRMNKAKWANLLFVALFYYVVLMRGHGWQGALHPYDLWWYLSAYVVICLLSPFIESGIQSLGETKVRYAVIGLLFYNYVGRWISGMNSHDMVYLLAIFLFARYVKVFLPEFISKKQCPVFHYVNNHLLALTIVLGLWIVIAPVVAVRLNLSDDVIAKIVSNNNITLLMFAFLLVNSAEKYCVRLKTVNWLASSILAIYLITDFPTVRVKINPYLFPYMMEWTGHIMALGICIGCIFIDKLRALLFYLGTIVLHKIIDNFDIKKGSVN